MSRTRGTAAAGALLVAACGLLTACGQEPAPHYDPVARSSPERGEGWSRVHLDAEVRTIEAINSENPPPHLLAAGVDDGHPLLVDITAWRRTPTPRP